jgi:pimeloyl-ACP methyl ester carboxylesterase
MEKGNINIGQNSIYFEFINPQYLQKNTPLLIFLHHGVGSVSQWMDFPELLSDSIKYPALLYDRYGYGKSDGLREARGTDYINHEAEAVLPELIKKLKIENKIILIGHSDGGSIALIFAAKADKNLSGIIVEAPHTFVDDYSVNGVKHTIEEYKAGVLKRALSKFHKENTDTMFYGWADIWVSEKFRSWNIEDMLKNIKVPVLAIQGRQDEYGTLDQIQKIKKSAGDKVSLCILDDCDHIPHKSHKEEVFELMKNFILIYCNK